MVSGENAIKTAAKLYEARDTMRRLFGGEKFKEMIGPRVLLIQTAMQATGLDALGAALDIANSMQDCGGIQKVMVLVAAVEMSEPSEEYKTKV